jgi:hypothetical protein
MKGINNCCTHNHGESACNGKGMSVVIVIGGGEEWHDCACLNHSPIPQPLPKEIVWKGERLTLQGEGELYDGNWYRVNYLNSNGKLVCNTYSRIKGEAKRRALEFIDSTIN